MQVKDLRAKLDPDIRYRRDQQAPGDIPRTTMKENFDDHSDLARGTGRRNGRAEAPNRLPAVLDALDAFAEAKMRNAVPERELRRAQRNINRYRRLMHADNRVPSTGRY